MTDSIFDVTDVAGDPKASKQIKAAVLLSDIGSPAGRLAEGTPVTLELSADAVTEGVRVSGNVEGVLELTCSACTIDFETDFKLFLDEVFRMQRTSPDDFIVEDGKVDLSGPLTDTIVLAIPPYPLHSPDCKGLCSTCGIDLNTQDCSHSQEPTNIKWEPLKELLKDGSERT